MTKVISFKEMEWRDGYNIKNDRSDKKVRKQACVCKPVFEILLLIIIIILIGFLPKSDSVFRRYKHRIAFLYIKHSIIILHH